MTRKEIEALLNKAAQKKVQEVEVAPVKPIVVPEPKPTSKPTPKPEPKKEPAKQEPKPTEEK